MIITLYEYNTFLKLNDNNSILKSKILKFINDKSYISTLTELKNYNKCFNFIVQTFENNKQSCNLEYYLKTAVKN